MVSSIMPVCKHPLCLNTGKRIREVDRVLLLVGATLGTWMVAQGTSADCSARRQRRSQNSSSCAFVKWDSKEEKKSPLDRAHSRDTLHSNYFLVISGWKLYLPISGE